jgi:WD40 repeat protein
MMLRGHSDGVTSVAFSPDGKRLASGSYDGTVKLWDLSLLPHDLTTLRYAAPVTLRGHTDCVQCVTFAPDGKRLASAASDYTVRLWRVDSAHPYEVAALRGHSDKVHAVAFSRNGTRLASGGKDRTVVVWDAVEGQIRNKHVHR